MAADNKSLGKFILDGIPPAMRGIPQIEVTFDIDANGILKVTALDKATGRSQNITITASSGLRDDEVNRMKHDAEVHAEEDRKRKELIEVRNQADNMVYTAEKALRDLGDKVPAEIKSKVEAEIAKVNQVRDKENAEEIRNDVLRHLMVRSRSSSRLGPLSTSRRVLRLEATLLLRLLQNLMEALAAGQATDQTATM